MSLTTAPTAPGLTAVSPNNLDQKTASTRHLDFLDGIRGLAALYVMWHHAYLLIMDNSAGGVPGSAGKFMSMLRPLAFGRFSVDMFIVLSGYCLMLPLARAQSAEVRGGFSGYILRRARRILPPYYAALVLSVGLIYLCQMVPFLKTAAMRQIFNPPSLANIGSHLLLVHNLINLYSHLIDPPMWSVATEWQIYFIFPLILLPVWRRLGMVSTVVVGFALGLSAHILAQGQLTSAAPWYIGLFTLGMAGASLTAAPGPRRVRYQNWPWGIVAALLCIFMVALGTAKPGLFKSAPPFADSVFGLASMCALVSCHLQRLRADSGRENPLLRLASSRFAVALGAFSYSIYLVHFPLLNLALVVANAVHAGPWLQVLAVFGVGLPVAFAAAYLFHLAFEKPFMSSPPQVRK